MKGKRRRHDPEFKARVAIEALKNIRTASEIAKEFQIHPAQVSDWKKQMLDGASDLFGAGKRNPPRKTLRRKRTISTPKSDSRPSKSTFCEKSQNNSVCEGSFRVG